MKIGDALQERAAAQRKIADLRGRIAATVTTNEDEVPIEDPTALLAESDAVADRLGDLIRRINASNSATSFPSGGTVTEALARRDVLSTKLATLDHVAKAVGGERRLIRFGRTELRTTVQIDVPQLRARVDSLAAELRNSTPRCSESRGTSTSSTDDQTESVAGCVLVGRVISPCLGRLLSPHADGC